MTYLGILTLIVAMVVAWSVTPVVIRLAGAVGALDLPGGRKAHVRPTPRIGGLAVYFGFLAGLCTAAFFTGVLFEAPRVEVYWRGLIAAATMLLLVGLVDDVRGLSFQAKFAAQILAAAAVWLGGFRIDVVSHPLGGALDLGWWSFPITVLWIVGITNAVNLIDGLDGLAAGIALISTIAVGIIAYVRLELGVAVTSLALAGSLIGFLRYNFNPARIFLGDSGSLFLGFILAVTSVKGQKGATAVAILAPILLLGLPLLDTAMAIVRRLYRVAHGGWRAEHGSRYVLRNLHHVFQPDREHIHHRLLDLGLSHRTAVLVLYGVGGLFVGAAFAFVVIKSATVGFLLLAVLGVAMAAFVLSLYLVTPRPPTASDPADRAAESEPAAPSLDAAWHVPGRRTGGH